MHDCGAVCLSKRFDLPYIHNVLKNVNFWKVLGLSCWLVYM